MKECNYEDFIRPSQASKTFTREDFVLSFTTNLNEKKEEQSW
jgi:hypothetical protein